MKLVIRIPLALILLFLAAVALTIYLATETTVFHRAANELLARYIEAKYNIDISFGKIGGSLLRGFTIDNLTVDYDSDSANYRMMAVERLEFYYDLKELWKGNWRLDSLTLIEPIFIVRSNPSGVPLVPKFVGEDKDNSGSPLDLSIDRLKLVNGRFQFFGSKAAYFIDSIDVIAAGKTIEGVFEARFDSLRLVYPRKDFRIQSARFNLALRERTLGIDSLQLRTPNSHLQGGGVYPLDKDRAFALRFVDSHLSLDEISHLFSAKLHGDVNFTAVTTGQLSDFSGSATMDGTFFERDLGPFTTDYHYRDGVLNFDKLQGSAFDGQVNGAIGLNLVTRPEIFSGNLTVRGINFDKIIPNTFTSRINGQMELHGVGFGENSFSLDLSVDCGPGRFDFVNYDSLVGSMSLNTVDLFIHPGFSLWYKNSRFAAEGVVNYDGEMLLDGDFQSTQLADFWGDLFIEELSGGGRGNYHVSGPTIDPDISGTFEGDSCSFYGFATESLTADFDISSFLYGRRGNVSLRASTSDVWNLPAESAFAAVEIDSDFVDVRRATIHGERYLLDGRGNAVIHDSTASVVIDSLLFQFDSLTYVSQAPFPVEFEADRIVVDGLRLLGDKGSALVRCEYGYDTTIALTVKVDSLALSPWLETLQADSLIRGYLTLEGTVTGRLSRPVVTTKSTVHDLTYAGRPLGKVEGELLYSDSVVEVRSLALVTPQSRFDARGNFPLLMDLDSGKVIVLDEPMHLAVASKGNDLSQVGLLLEDLESLTGDYILQFEIYGTPQQPQSKGFFKLNNGSAKIYYLENPIENIKTEISSNDRVISIDWAEGTASYKGKKGQMMASGEIEIKSLNVFDYDLQIVGFNVPFKYDLGDISGRADFDLQVRGDAPPRVTGNVTIAEGAYYDEFEAEELTAALEAADTAALWDYEIQIEMLPGAMKVKNSETNSIVDGNLTVIRQNAKDNYIGELNIVRGKYYLLDMTFDIEEGSKIIYNNIEYPNPELNVRIKTSVRNTSAGETASYSNLDLLLGGTLLQPSLNSAAGSGFSNADIVPLLLANRPATDLPQSTSPLESRLQVGAYGYLANLTSVALRRSLGVEELAIVPTYGEKNQLQGATLTFGFYTTSNLYTYVTSPLTLEQSAEFGAEWRLGRHIFLSGNHNRENLYRFNLNFNWEFK